MQRILLIILGWLAVILATLGVVLPLLPTTPFLLLAAWCFARSSPRFHYWLLYRSWFGPALRNWQHHRAMSARVKSRIVIFIIITFCVSLYLTTLLWIRVFLVLLMCLLLFFIWRIPVVDEKQHSIDLK